MLLASLLKLSNLMRGLGKDEKPQQEKWFGSYLDEDGIVADVLKRVRADEVALKRWLDPWSWKFPAFGARPIPFAKTPETPPDHAGCLVFASRGIRNYYGLWHADNPYVVVEDAQIDEDGIMEDGVITDPRHPDNLSGRVVDRVRAELAAEVSRKLCHGNTKGPCKCQERMGNDFYFLPKGQCLFNEPSKDAA